MSKSMISQDGGKKVLLMGNEAIARGAVEAGIQLMAAYPGTPSSEVCEALIDAADENNYYIEWSTNEKIAYEVAAGAAIVGARSLTAMKNAGLNVAMDSFMTIPYGGVKGGMVVVVADDPDAHYSSTEQDTRTLAAYAEIPCLEPMDQQEAKEMTRDAFDISEELELPVFLRSVSRLSHASGDVTCADITTKKNNIAFNKHYKLPFRWDVYGAPGPVSKHVWLKEALAKAGKLSNESRYNTLDLVEGSKIGIMASGIAVSYTKDALNRLGIEDKVSFLKLGFIHPLPEDKVSAFLSSVDTVICVEEGDPVIENMLRNYAKEHTCDVKFFGKSGDRIFNPYGEINSDIVREAVAKVMDISLEKDKREAAREEIRKMIAPRSSTLCAGCSHLGSYWALKQALKGFKGVHIVNGDIGCYEQGGYGLFGSKLDVTDEESKKHPIKSAYEILDTIYVMGSGIGLAQGQAQVGYKDGKVVAVAGDSTIIQACLPSLVNAVYSNADITFLVLDNSWTAMTGHQVNPNTGLDTCGNKVEVFDMEGVVKSLGVKSIGTVSSYDLEEAETAIKEALEFEGPSVVILRGECMLQVQRRNRTVDVKTWVDQELCTGCKQCVQLGCSAITFDSEKKKAGIDKLNCTDCNLCVQVCQFDAIKVGRS